MTQHVLAIDWSGAAGCEDDLGSGTLWWAEAIDGRLVQLRPSSRLGAIARIREAAGQSPELIVGIDVAFSYPAWFVEGQGFATAVELWSGLDPEVSRAHPFWGWKSSRRPDGVELLRETDRAMGTPIKSSFQVGGAGHVGTGLLRALPHLAALAADGIALWPFAPAVPGSPVVLEIYPRRFTVPRVVKSDPVARADWWAVHGPPGQPAVEALVAMSEDAFDAAVSAIALARRYTAARSLPPITDLSLLREGWIFDLPLSER